MGRKAKLRQHRPRPVRAAAPEFNPEELLTNGFARLAKEQPHAVLNFAGLASKVIGCRYTSEEYKGTLVSTPTLHRLRRWSEEGSELEKRTAEMVHCFAAIGYMGQVMKGVPIPQVHAREMFVRLCNSPLLRADLREYFLPDIGVWKAEESIAGLLLGAFGEFNKQAIESIIKREIPKETWDNHELVEGLRTHLSALHAIEFGRDVLFHSEHVLLFLTPQFDEEGMTLALKSEDGLWQYSPRHHRGCCPRKELQALKQWVHQYDGPTVEGETANHRSARLLQWLGFQVGPDSVRAERRASDLDGTWLEEMCKRPVLLVPAKQALKISTD